MTLFLYYNYNIQLLPFRHIERILFYDTFYIIDTYIIKLNLILLLNYDTFYIIQTQYNIIYYNYTPNYCPLDKERISYMIWIF
jgi:hypothetical protein